jgi:hypothetical protein
MNLAIRALVTLWVGTSLMTAADKRGPGRTKMTNDVPPRILSFCADKEDQVKRLAARLKVEIPAVVVEYFDAARKGDWVQAFELYSEVRDLLQNSPSSPDQQVLEATARATVLEVLLALEQFVEGEPSYAFAFGRDIIKSIPTGSIYFGGTDPGRGLVTALCTSHEKGIPFFTLTQNALPDGGYLTYLRTMYGGKIYTPTDEDSSWAFKDYLDDAERRLKHDEKFPNEPRQIKPGEDVRMKNNKVTVGGQIAVVAIRGRLAKVIFDKNPDRDFFIEESFPLDWMYPHLSPHGLILKIHRKPLTMLSAEDIAKDRAFWLDQQRTLVGGWLKAETSVKEICAFAEKVFLDRNLEGFMGDPKFVQSDSAAKMYSKLRSSIAGVYAWRMAHSQAPEEKERMRAEADFAFRQAFAFCPYSLEALFRYVNQLEYKRFDDALLLAKTASSLAPGNGQLDQLILEIERMKRQ